MSTDGLRFWITGRQRSPSPDGRTPTVTAPRVGPEPSTALPEPHPDIEVAMPARVPHAPVPCALGRN
ncbi:hypothetical protein B005_3588 [Nocardiopsis alba ATCC BAA-2165]|uniref:Uncharacterized protein n=1 Tax=Nocardiopsis alba (strain ATCC BAA-2165 / BE74) TaxID=1205910 RepID=J7L510_NOCAA|nr:hypothetical protein B005_3588 [Nocardiopsis alba ATCC BAA-2165]